MTAHGVFISRLPQDSGAHNTINTPTVTVYFQKAPGLADGNDRGVENLDFRVTSGGAVVQTGKTKADGKIVVRLFGGKATLELLHSGTSVAAYEITKRAGEFDGDDTIEGVQQRLRLLGYQIGRDGPDADGVTADLNKPTDRAILDFQIDQKAVFDGRMTDAITAILNASVTAVER